MVAGTHSRCMGKIVVGGDRRMDITTSWKAASISGCLQEQKNTGESEKKEVTAADLVDCAVLRVAYSRPLPRSGISGREEVVVVAADAVRGF